LNLYYKNLGYKRLLEVDKRLYLPFKQSIYFMVTSRDVLHSFSVPNLGLKIDSNPGRLNSMSVSFDRLGLFYGQCSELCGVSHGFMPIVIEIMA
jgi:heme/copper-type cytochrome/quinol oxidase subunit 2